jgi:probable phosphoglycerate mutase
MGVLILVRHGQTEWSANGRHTSYTDIDLTPVGEQQARDLARCLQTRRFAAVLISPRQRARRTAELAGLTGSTAATAIDEDLVEWNYGDYEGITTAEIRKERPDWDLWTHGSPGGESPDQVAARLDRVLDRARKLLRDSANANATNGDGDADADVALVAHGHALRVLGARWIRQPPATGGRLRLDTGTICMLGYEHEREVILEWNRPVV